MGSWVSALIRCSNGLSWPLLLSGLVYSFRTDSMAGDEEPMEFPEFPEGEGDFLADGDFPAMEGEEGGELPPQPKQKPKYFVHWDRRKAKFYDYNYDYGTNYYSSMVGYVDSKNAGHPDVPPRLPTSSVISGAISALSKNPNDCTPTARKYKLY